MRLLLYCTATLLILLETSQALDLTPHAAFRYSSEAPPNPAVQIADGTKKITFLPPTDWVPQGNAKSLVMNAPGNVGAWMKLVVVEKKDQASGAPPAATASATPSPEDLQALAKQYVPAGAQNVVFVQTTSSPFMVLSRSGTEYVFTFSRYGSRESIAISFIDFSDTEQLVVMYSAGTKDFAGIRQDIIGSMYSWMVLK